MEYKPTFEKSFGELRRNMTMGDIWYGLNSILGTAMQFGGVLEATVLRSSPLFEGHNTLRDGALLFTAGTVLHGVQVCVQYARAQYYRNSKE